MDSLKNLVIIALLAAVGFWVYTSLKRNNEDGAPPPGVAAGWPGGPKVDLSGTKLSTAPGGPLALGSGNPSASATQTSTKPEPSNATPSTTAPALTSVKPYPSSATDPIPTTGGTASLPSTPSATLGAPVTAEASPSTDAVRNLAPPPTVASAAVNTTPPAVPPADSQFQGKFAAFMEAVQKKLAAGELAEAHLALSSLYGNPDLPPEQANQLVKLLDQLAGTVIYSRKHYLEPAYVTQSGDTLDALAKRYDVPWQLIGRINGLLPPGPIGNDDPTKDQPLPSGQELKVVRGPFEATINLSKHELTLMIQNRYAGRFKIGVGRDEPKLEGEYTIREKTPSPAYHGPDGSSVNPNDPQNPLGSAWIGLNERIGIHGTNDPTAVGRDDNRGNICVGDRDLQDLYGILSVGSRVTILR